MTQTNVSTEKQATNDAIAGFDIHILKENGENGSYLTTRIVNTASTYKAVVEALFDEKAGDLDDIKKYIEEGFTFDSAKEDDYEDDEDWLIDCLTVEDVMNLEHLLYDEDGISYEVTKIIPLKKVDIQVEYSGQLLDKTIFLPIDPEENSTDYFA